MSNLTRRQVLGTVAAGSAVALAGCGGGDTGSSGGDGGTSNVFENVELDGQELVVTVASDAVAEITTVAPNDRAGEQYSLGSVPVDEGASTVGFNLLQNYLPGEHTLVAADGDGNEIGATTQQLNPEVEIERVLTKPMNPDNEWGVQLNNSFVLTLTNTGNAPAKLSHIIYENIPEFSQDNEEYLKNTKGEVGIANVEGEQITEVMPGESVTGVTVTVLGMTDNFECSGTKTASIIIGYQGETTTDVPINYETTGGAFGEQCKATVTDQP
jgi:hypothetical protein